MKVRAIVALTAVWVLAWGSLAADLTRAHSPHWSGTAQGQVVVDAQRVGTLEQQAWEAYYLREWPRLGLLLLELIEDQFGLTRAQATEAALVATQAQIVFAQQGAAGGQAEALMRQFYTLVREPFGGSYDPARAAALEVGWWVVHRERAASGDSRPLVDALAALSAELYQVPVDVVWSAAEHRAAAMDVSDRWVAEGREPTSPLLVEVRNELVSCYTALFEAVGTP